MTSKLEDPVKCKGCKKEFVRQHPREGYCSPDCKAASKKKGSAKSPALRAVKKRTRGGTHPNGARPRSEPAVRSSYAAVIADLDADIAKREDDLTKLRGIRDGLAAL